MEGENSTHCQYNGRLWWPCTLTQLLQWQKVNKQKIYVCLRDSAVQSDLKRQHKRHVFSQTIHRSFICEFLGVWKVSFRATGTCHTTRANKKRGSLDVLAKHMMLLSPFQEKMEHWVFQTLGHFFFCCFFFYIWVHSHHTHPLFWQWLGSSHSVKLQKRNVTRASIDIVVRMKWFKLQFWVNIPFNMLLWTYKGMKEYNREGSQMMRASPLTSRASSTSSLRSGWTRWRRAHRACSTTPCWVCVRKAREFPASAPAWGVVFRPGSPCTINTCTTTATWIPRRPVGNFLFIHRCLIFNPCSDL